MKINIAKEIRADYITPNAAVDNLMTMSSFYGAVSLNVYDEVWDEVRMRCFNFYLVSNIPWTIERKLDNYEY